MNCLNYKFVPGLRRGSKLLYIESEQQLYLTRSSSKNSVRYVCYNKNCNASVSIDNATKKCRKLNETVHDHENQAEFVKKLNISDAIKTECHKVNLKRSATREIFDRECVNNPEAAHLVQYGKMKRNLCRIKMETLPKNPTCPLDIKNMFNNLSILEKFGTSKSCFHQDAPADTKLFYRATIVENNFSYSIFMSPKISEAIKTNPQIGRNFLMDATFGIVPDCGYKQLLIVHVEYLNHVSK